MTGVWSCIRHAFCLDVAKNSPARADSTSSNQIWRLSRALETWPPGQIRVVKIMRSILNRTLLMERGSVHVWLGSSLAMHLIGRGSDGGCRKERLRAATWDPGAAGDNKVCIADHGRCAVRTGCSAVAKVPSPSTGLSSRFARRDVSVRRRNFVLNADGPRPHSGMQRRLRMGSGGPEPSRVPYTKDRLLHVQHITGMKGKI